MVLLYKFISYNPTPYKEGSEIQLVAVGVAVSIPALSKSAGVSTTRLCQAQHGCVTCCLIGSQVRGIQGKTAVLNTIYICILSLAT